MTKIIRVESCKGCPMYVWARSYCEEKEMKIMDDSKIPSKCPLGDAPIEKSCENCKWYGVDEYTCYSCAFSASKLINWHPKTKG